ncbi:SAM-dependent methyltransferase [Candidatus Cyrtobacter comes]|uniref:SAM-dependent methyltransferase n=1 Tax=Candidatus Cyrtobacter comes TaxID=675776 RepID=A0ABU5L8K1_9RICK|nr:SAM-dependent methyltransferase [Candidatus Cyrtobacter comes]MDZ5762453.1 SAM-dependent methyltransferase [Candidatus Cyrtobacter comes]
MSKTFKDKIIDLIRQHGPIPMDQFISLSSYNYYNNCNSIVNDFITAPQVSQMFGEIVGIWALSEYLKKGNEKPITIIELGPGSGIMMLDILRNKKLANKIQNIFLYDISQKLIEDQKKNLKNYLGLIKWFSSTQEIEENIQDDQYIIFVANEFFDALPIKQYYKNQDMIKEVCVAVTNYELSLVLSGTNNTKICSDHNDGIIEISAYWENYLDFISTIIKKHCGSAIIIDYGYIINEFKSSLQSVKNHQKCHILEHPGESDITSLVNFSYFAEIFQKHILDIEIRTQEDFLLKFGIEDRAEVLKKNGSKNIEWQLEFLLKKMNNFFVITV